MVLVTAIISIKILGNLKLQLKEIHQYFYIYLNKSDIPNDSFYYMYRIEKSNSVFFFFSSLTVIYFVPVLQLQANWMMVYQ